MTTDLPGGTVPLLFKGTFDFHAIYRASINWMKKYECRVYEPLYKDKISGPGITEKEIKLLGDVKFDEYLKWTANVTIKVWDAKILPQKGPSGHNLIQGRIDISIKGELTADYQKTFEGAGLAANLGKIINKLFSRGSASQKIGESYVRIYELQDTCKQILGIESK